MGRVDESREYFFAEIMAEPIIYGVAENGGDGKKNKKEVDIQSIGCSKCAGNEEQRVPRKKRGENKTSFHEDNEEEKKIDNTPVGLDESSKIEINVKNEIENCF